MIMATIQNRISSERFQAACIRAQFNPRHVTMLWNLADGQDEPERLWAILAAICPGSFADARDVNTIQFSY